MGSSAEKTRIESPVWWLAGAAKYKSNHGGSFSPTSVVSQHMFGWDKEDKCFVFENDYGSLVRPTRQTMSVPVELAEKFLLRCREPEFNKRMLAASCDSPELAVEEVLRHGGLSLEIRRTKNESTALRFRPPSLFLVLRSELPVVGFVLFSEMREKLGKSVAAVSEEIIREQLGI